MQNNNWIKIFRKLREWEWYRDSCVKDLFLEILLSVNYEERAWQGIKVTNGNLISSISKLSLNTGLSYQQTRTALDKLKSTGEITIKTTNKYTLITVNNFDKYQQSTNNLTDNQQTINAQPNKQATTTKEYKELEEIKNINITPTAVDADVEKLLKDKSPIKYEWQYLGLEIFDKLKFPENKKSALLKLARDDMNGVSAAFQFSVDYPSATKWKIFLWKYNQLKKLPQK